MKAPFRRLSPPTMNATVLKNMTRALVSGDWAPGIRGTTLEQRIARQIGVHESQVIATDSCTSALAAAKRFLLGPTLPDNGGWRPPVRVCPLTWPSTYLGLGGRLEWVDCDEEGWPVDYVDIGVELWGRKWYYDPQRTMGEYPLILDAAHRFAGAEHARMLKAGTKAICYSFGPQKEVPCWNGGALVLAESENSEKYRTWLNFGVGKDRLPMFADGIRGLMPDVNAAWLNEQMKRHSYLAPKRQRVLQWYEDHLGPGILLTRAGEASGHLCVLDCKSPVVRSLYKASLDRNPTVQSSVHYPLPPSARRQCCVAADLSDRILSLPCHVEMTQYDVRRVVMRLLQA